MLGMICRMNSTQLRKNFNPAQLAKQNEEIRGQISLHEFERLNPLLKESGASVDFSLEFMQDDASRTIVRLRVNAECVVECGRCLKPMPYPIVHSVELAVVANDDEAAELPETYEPLLLAENSVDLAILIEDELLLNLPVMPSHSEGECSVSIPSRWTSNESERARKPFAVLKKLSDSRDTE